MKKYEPDIYKLTNELLLEPTTPYIFGETEIDPVHLSNSLTMTRHHLNGVGLTANQVGLPYSVISIRGIESAMFNPKIIMESTERTVMEEGCLSYPGLVLHIKRPEYIRLRYADAFGKVTTQAYFGMTARVIQHEMTHINGLTFFHDCSKLKLSNAIKKAKKKHGIDYYHLLESHK